MNFLFHSVCVTVRITITWSRKLKWCKPQVQFNSFPVSSPLMAFPGLITIVDCQRTHVVVGLTDLLFPPSNLSGSEKLSPWACSTSTSTSSPPDVGESSDLTDPWSNATRRFSSRQLKQKLFPCIFYYLNFPDDTLSWIFIVTVPSLVYKRIFFWLFQPSQTHVIFQERVTRRYGGDLLKELQGRKEWYTFEIVLESNYVAFWIDNPIFFGCILNCSLSFTPLNLFQQINFSMRVSMGW